MKKSDEAILVSLIHARDFIENPVNKVTIAWLLGNVSGILNARRDPNDAELDGYITEAYNYMNAGFQSDFVKAKERLSKGVSAILKSANL